MLFGTLCRVDIGIRGTNKRDEYYSCSGHQREGNQMKFLLIGCWDGYGVYNDTLVWWIELFSISRMFVYDIYTDIVYIWELCREGIHLHFYGINST